MLGVISLVVLGVVCVLLVGQYSSSCTKCSGRDCYVCGNSRINQHLDYRELEAKRRFRDAANALRADEAKHKKHYPEVDPGGPMEPIKPAEAAAAAMEPIKPAEATAVDYVSLSSGISYIREHEGEISFADGKQLESRLSAMGGTDGVRTAPVTDQASLMDIVLQLVMKIKGK